MSEKKTEANAYASFPVLGILGIVFIVLKLTDQIDWAWKWVLSPFWIPWAIFLVFMAIGALIYTATESRKNYKRKKSGVHKDGRRY